MDYSKLNENQKKAVTTIDGPVLILAGPGTGKTTVLSYRIAEILQKTDTKPESILAVTFTEAGVSAMRKKLTELIGKTAYDVSIETIHSFCNRVILDYNDHFPHLIEYIPLTDLERIEIFNNIFEDNHFKELSSVNRPFNMYGNIVSNITSTKREYITTEQFQKGIEIEKTKLDSMEKFKSRGPEKGKGIRDDYARQQKLIRRMEEFLKILDLYQTELKNRKRYDYDDMICEVINALKNDAELRSALQEKYQYLIVDEYQDTNDAQNTLLFLLAEYWGQEANIFVVGDDDQAIYRFQGASVKNIKDYIQKYPKANVITLTDNYRSNQTILDAARSLIEKSAETAENLIPGISKKLTSRANLKRKKIRLYHFGEGITEAVFIAEKVKALIKKGVKPEEIAILVRMNAHMDPIADIFQRWKISYTRPSGDNALERPIVKQLMIILNVINQLSINNKEELLTLTMLHYQYWGVPKIDLIKLAQLIDKDKNSFWEYVVNDNKTKEWKEKGITDNGAIAIKECFTKLTTWATSMQEITLSKLIERVISESGMLDYVLSLPSKYELVNSLNSMFAEVKALVRSNPEILLKEFLEAIELMKECGVGIREQKMAIDRGGVSLLTAHGAKGLEYDYVFIPYFNTKNWDSKQTNKVTIIPPSVLGVDTEPKDKQKQALEDDRRLLYVALTRARKKVFLSHADTYIEDFGNERHAQESKFIHEIDRSYIRELGTKKYEELTKENMGQLLRSTPYQSVYINTVEEQDIIRSILSRFVLSPTALNNYFNCPMQFLVNNILRIPRAVTPALVYGTSVHAALEYMYRELIQKRIFPPLEDILTHFDIVLENQPIKASSKAKRKTDGHNLLNFYYQIHKENPIIPIKTEHYLRPTLLGGAHIKGTVDKIEPITPASKNVVVIDYKTGPHLTQSKFDKIEINTRYKKMEDAKVASYKRQLLFYKILADYDPIIINNHYNVVIGRFEFVDPKKGYISKVEIEYSNEALEEMKSVIIDVWNKIQKLEFPRIHGPKEKCEFCSLGL